ncbi:MAG: hypothetical protein R3A44_23315 [Caldilineaceae bacterium]
MKSLFKSKQIILAALTLMTLILGACVALPNQPVAGDQPAASVADQPATTADPEPVILWHREGGFAGFCDDIIIYANGDVTISSCRGNQSEELAHIQLGADQQATLDEWLARLQPFKAEQKDPAVADAITMRLQFAGAGNAAASAAEQAAIADFAQSMLNRLGESPTGLGGKEYANPQGGFTLQYPADAVRYESARPSVDGALAQAFNTVAFANSEPAFVLTITWFDLTADATLRSFMDANSECPDATATGGQPFQIDGHEALIYPNTPCGAYGATYFFTLVDSRGYRFTVETMSSYDDVRGAVEDVLHTLHFEPFHAAESAPALCPQPTDATRLLLDGASGYCLLYPAAYTPVYLPDGAIELVSQSILNHTDPLASLSVLDANGRTLEQVATEWEELYAHQGIDTARGLITVDGVDAVMLDNLPGQDLNRRVALVHNGRIYSFFFTPLGDEGAARANMEAFYQSILDSFRFLDETVAEPLPRPEAADVVETDVQYVQALVNINIRSGPGTTYGVVGSVFAGQTALVTGAMPDGSWWRVICPDDTVGSCFVVNDPTLTQPTSAPDVVAPSGDSATGTVVYADTTAGFAFDYPAAWAVSGGETGSRGAITQLAAPDGTQLDVSVLNWDPQNDLDAYLATRKIAWDASGITILQEDEWTLHSGQPAMRFIVRGADGASTGFFLFAALDGRYLTLSGSGNFEALDAIAKSLRIGEE